MSGTMQCRPDTLRLRTTTGRFLATVRSSVSDSRELAMTRPSSSGSERRSISRSSVSDSWLSESVTTKPASAAAAWQPRITRKLNGFVMSATASPSTVVRSRAVVRATSRLR